MRPNDNNATQWLAQSVETLVQFIDDAGADPLFDVVIVGSGYGGAVAAARLAGCHEAGRDIRVCVLERGREYLPGMFPQRLDELPAHVRFGTLNDPTPKGNRSGLFDLRLAPDVSVLLGNGLGGGSLINAGVMAEPRPEVFGFDWPREIDHAGLRPHFDTVRAMIGVEKTTTTTDKLRSLKRLGRALEAEQSSFRCSVAVHFAPPGQKPQPGECLNCGDCFTGCNHGAKNTLDTNYLKLARERGAEIYTGATVLAIERPASQPKSWDVLFTFTHAQTSPSDRGPFRLRCQRVILAAGSLGSTEILLRSEQRSQSQPRRRMTSRLLPIDTGLATRRSIPLKFSASLGQRFSTNGDMFAVAYRQPQPANAAARQHDPPTDRRVGPTITGLIDLRGAGEKPLSQQIVIEEMAIPGALRTLFAELVTTSATLHEILSPRSRPSKATDPLAVDDGAIQHTAFYALMGHDGAAGRLQLQQDSDPRDPTDGRVYPRWSGAGQSPVFKLQIERLEAACRGSRQRAGLCDLVIASPLWRPLPEASQKLALGAATGDLITVHPLGGCAMGRDASEGVTDHLGRVFDAASEQHLAVYEGLVVLDGAIIPGSLGINPALTIAAVSERAVSHLKQEWRLTDRAAAARTIPPRPTMPPGSKDYRPPKATMVQISELLSGPVTIGGQPFGAELQVAFVPIAVPGEVAGKPRVTAKLMLSDRAAGRHVRTLELEGQVELFQRETDSRVVRVGRAIVAYLHNRAASDMRTGLGKKIARIARRLRGQPADSDDATSLCDWWRLIYRLCESACQAWKLRYVLSVVGNTPRESPLQAGDELTGIKLVTYARKSNPWRQLSEVEITWHRKGRRRRKLGTLTLDLGYFVRSRQPLLCITEQQNQPQAIADLLSFGAYVVRLLLRVHILSFKPQDRRRPEEEGNLSRLFPGALPEAPAPEVTQLTTARSLHGDARVRLTRYRPRTEMRSGPVLLIHGFGASGSTFAHPSLEPNLVQRLASEGFDTWVADLRTSVAMPTASHTWPLDEVARTDVVAAVEEVLAATGAPQVNVVAHCIGAAMFAYAVLGGRLEGKIRAAVLSQVGPVTKFSAPNFFRAYLASYLAQYVPARVFDIRPSPAQGMLETAIDRLLATYPYDDREWYFNNPLFGQRVPHAAMRRRADAIWGQLFEHRNVERDVATKLDEFLGRVNVGNLAQTMHYALREALTIEQGLGSALDPRRLQKLWAFPTRFLFGELNRVFDRNGVHDSCQLLGRLLTEQATARSSGKPPFDCCLIPGFGHQDVFIGQEADERVFRPYIVPFLATNFGPIVPVAGAAAREAAGLKPPRFGPVLGWLRSTVNGTQVRMTVGPPVELPDGAPRLVGAPAASLLREAASDAPGWPRRVEVVFPDGSGDISGAVDFSTGSRLTPEGGLVPDKAPGYFHISPHIQRARDRGLCDPDDGGLSFALGSCQYPAGLLDRRPAMASFERLATRINDGTAESPQFLLLIGDQIYADETAGLFASNITDEPYTGFHERLFGRDEVQRVVGRLPTYMMLDDHELWDNWEPPRAGDRMAEHASRQAGLAFERYQWNVGPGRAYQQSIGGTTSYWYPFYPGGVPFFMMDTRTERDRRVARRLTARLPGTKQVSDAQIISEHQWRALERWLTDRARDPRSMYAPKFVVSPLVVFPWCREFDDDPATAARWDGWDGYPASLRRLLRFIAAEQIENVVFLSGDRHASLVARADLACDGKTVTAHSIVSSALYAPFPFINAKPRDLALDTSGTWPQRRGPLEYRVQTLQPSAGSALTEADSYAIVHATRSSAGWQLQVVFETADGTVRYPALQLSGARAPERIGTTG